MNVFFENTKENIDKLEALARELLVNPLFWSVVVIIFVVSFFSNNTRKRSGEKAFSSTIVKMLHNLWGIFLDLFNSVLDVVGVLLNFIKELSSLLFGSLNESRVQRLAGFGVIFFSAVSFYTTSQGLINFTGVGANYLLSFGIQSAILIISFKIIKDWKQRKEIDKQLLKHNSEEIHIDMLFIWQKSLKARFKKAKRMSVKLEEEINRVIDVVNKKNEKKELVGKVLQIKKIIEKISLFLSSDTKITNLFSDSIDKKSLDKKFTNLFDDMEKKADSTESKRDANKVRIEVVEDWIKNEYSEFINEIERISSFDEKIYSNINKELNDIKTVLFDEKSNHMESIFEPKPIFKQGINAVERIVKKRKLINGLQAYRYSSGTIKQYYKAGHFIRLGALLLIFIFLSSSFSYTFIINNAYSDKIEIEKYHMTLKLCDDMILNYQNASSRYIENSRKVINDFVDSVQNLSELKISIEAYNKYYDLLNYKEELKSSITENDDYEYTLQKEDELKEVNSELEDFAREKEFYENLLTFIKLLDMQEKNETSLEVDASASNKDENERTDNTIINKEEFDINKLVNSNDLNTAYEKLILNIKNCKGQENKDWSKYKSYVSLYQCFLLSNEEFSSFLDELNKITSEVGENLDSANVSRVALNEPVQKESQEDSNNLLKKSQDIIDLSKIFISNVIFVFGNKNQKEAVELLNALYEIKNSLLDQERFLNQDTHAIEEALTFGTSKYVARKIPAISYIVSVLIDLSVLLILFIRGVSNKPHTLDKVKVLLARLFLKKNNSNLNIPFVCKAILGLIAIIVPTSIMIFVDLPEKIQDYKELITIIVMLIILFFGAEGLRIFFKNKLPNEKGKSHREINNTINTCFGNLLNRLIASSMNFTEQENIIKEYESLLKQEFPNLSLYITDDMKTLIYKIKKGELTDDIKMSGYVKSLKISLLNKAVDDILSEYLNELCIDFLKSVQSDDLNGYGGYNFILHRVLSQCNNSEKLFDIYYESLYPTVFYIDACTMKTKGFEPFINILVGEDLAHYEGNKVYFSPLMFRIFNEILFLRLSDEEFEFDIINDYDTDLGMDEVIEAYIEAKYLTY